MSRKGTLVDIAGAGLVGKRYTLFSTKRGDYTVYAGLGFSQRLPDEMLLLTAHQTVGNSLSISIAAPSGEVWLA